MKIDLYNGDCLEEMKQIPDCSVDLILTDPPYGTTACKWDTIIDLDLMWFQLKRVIKTNGAIVLNSSQPFTAKLISTNFEMFKYCWVWKKNRATGHVHAKNKPMKLHEDICVFSTGTTVHASQSKTRMPYYPQGLIELPKGTKRRTRNDAGDNTIMGKRKSHKETITTHTGYPTTELFFPIEMNDDRFHPTQKPVALMEYLIKTYTLENETVLDFTMGSGTTGIACKNLNRDFIGIEMDDTYFKLAKERIETMNPLNELFKI